MRRFKALAALLVIALMLPGCGISGIGKIPGRIRYYLSDDTRVIITSTVPEDELFRIDDITCSLREYQVYLINMQKIYEQGFGAEMWNGEEGEAMAQSVMDNALADISRTKAMVLMAASRGISLSETEEAACRAAADYYYSTLSQADITAFQNAGIETFQSLVMEYVLSEKVYRYLIRDINPEISDDEARLVTVRQIALLKTKDDGSGARAPVTEEERLQLSRKITMIRNELDNGTDFDELAASYNEAAEQEFTFGRGERDKALEEAAYSLALGESSRPVETSDSFVILKLIETSDRATTEANKVNIMEQRKHEVFDGEYDSFVSGLARTLDENVYARASLASDPEVTTDSFFRICSETADACLE